MNLLIICHHDPQSNMIAAVRVRKFAEHLSARDCSVKVLSRVGVTSYEHGVPTIGAADPLLHAAVSAVNLGSGAASRAQQTGAPGPASRSWSKVRPIAAWIVRHLIAVPDIEVVSVRTLLKKSLDLGAWRPEVIVASGPPFSTFFVARHLARARRIPWVADYRDLWTLSSYYPLGPIRRRLDRVLETRVLRSVSLVITTSQPCADEMTSAFGVCSEVVFNGFDPSDFAPVVEPVLVTGLPLRIVYTGEIYEGKRDPEPLFVALASMGVGADQLQVEFYGNNVRMVEVAAKRHGVERLVSCGSRLSYSESLALQQGADISLLLMWNNPGERGVYTGKLFEYLGARRPILMLGFDSGVAADLIRSRGAGVLANSPTDIASALWTWLATKRENGSVPALPKTVSLGLTRQEQSERLGRLCQSLIPAAGTRVNDGHDPDLVVPINQRLARGRP